MTIAEGMTMSGTNIQSSFEQIDCLKFFRKTEEIVNDFKIPIKTLSLVLEYKK